MQGTWHNKIGATSDERQNGNIVKTVYILETLERNICKTLEIGLERIRSCSSRTWKLLYEISKVNFPKICGSYQISIFRFWFATYLIHNV